MNSIEIKEHVCSLSGYQLSEWASIKLLENNECHSHDFGFFFDNAADGFERFINSVYCVVQRHEVLCSIYGDKNGRAFVSKNICTEIPTSKFDLTNVAQDKEFSRLQELSKNFCSSRFDLDFEIPVRLMQVKLLHNAYYVVVRVHRMVLDSAAVRVFINEIIDECKASDEVLKDYEYYGVLPSYFVEQESNFLRSELFKIKLNNTVSMLQGIPLVNNLPTDGSRLIRQSYRHSGLTQKIDNATSDYLLKFCEKHNITLFHFLESVFAWVISRYSGESDIVIGSQVSQVGNNQRSTSIGNFENVVVMRSQRIKTDTFLEFLFKNVSMIDVALTTADIPYSILVENLNPVRSPLYSPVTQIYFGEMNDLSLTEPCPWVDVQSLNRTSLSPLLSCSDLVLNFHKSDQCIKLRWSYQQDLFESSSVEQISAIFLETLQDLFDGAFISENREDIRMPSLSVIACEAKDTGFNSVIDLIKDVAATSPNSVALAGKCNSLTYAELDKISDEMANFLISLGAGKKTLIGAFFDRGIDMVVAIMSILKTGAAYLPIDPALPIARNEIIIQESGVSLVLFGQTLQDELDVLIGLKDSHCTNNAMGITAIPFSHQNTAYKELAIRPECKLFDSTLHQDAAYVIYTSGSTGQPKGVVGLHKGIINRINFMKKILPIHQADKFCLLSSLSMVDHVAEIFQPLTSGSTLFIFSQEIFENVELLAKEIIAHAISRITAVPSLLAKLSESFKNSPSCPIKYIFSSGDVLTYNLSNEIYKSISGVRLFNVYGASETSADVTFYEVNNYSMNEQTESFFNKNTNVNFSIDKIDGSLVLLDQVKEITKPNVNLDELKQLFLESDLPGRPMKVDDYIEKLNTDILPHIIDVSSATFIGHMTSALPSFVPDMMKSITRINQNNVKIETSKALTFVERQVVAMLHKLFYASANIDYDRHIQDLNHVFGVVTGGGSVANITALWCARHAKLECLGVPKSEIVKKGAIKAITDLGFSESVIICSRLAHYSVRKAASLLGIGECNILIVEQDEYQRASIKSLEEIISNCNANKKFIIAIIGIAGATETGTIDPLTEMGLVAQKYGVYYHVDAAWGGALIFSEKHKHKLDGIELSNSITFCAHKQLYMPQGISLCLFKNTRDLYSSSVHTDYQGQIGSFDMGQFTLEGSRPANSLVLHAALNLLSKDGFGNLIDRSMEITNLFLNLLKKHECFEIIGSPGMNIVNYRYVPASIRRVHPCRYTETENEIINAAVEDIQQCQFVRGKTFVSKTKIFDATVSSKKISVFRVVLSNPMVDVSDLCKVIDDQIEISKEIVEKSRVVNEKFLESKKILSSIRMSQINKFNVPIGTPIDNTHIYILDNNLNIVPKGAIGEIFIAGASVSGGYFRRPDLNAKSFIESPFSSNETLYRTRDYGRFLPCGALEFLGRHSDVFKAGGHRFEVSEIRSVLKKIPDIDDAFVIIDEKECGIYMAAYLIPKELCEAEFSKDKFLDSIGRYVRTVLPKYMIPDDYFIVKNFPVIGNGKVDRKSLKKTNFGNGIGDFEDKNYIRDMAYENSSNDSIRIKLISVWKEVVGLEQVNINDNFFELGGTSILALQLACVISQRFSINVKSYFVFEMQTIGDQIHYLEGYLNKNKARHEFV